MTKSEEDIYLETLLYKALDEWLCSHVVTLLKNIAMQSSDSHAVDRALNGVTYAINGWRNGRAMIPELSKKK